jgi:hypothetical protein
MCVVGNYRDIGGALGGPPTYSEPTSVKDNPKIIYATKIIETPVKKGLENTG